MSHLPVLDPTQTATFLAARPVYTAIGGVQWTTRLSIQNPDQQLLDC